MGEKSLCHWIPYINFKGTYRCSNCGYNEQLLFFGEAPEICPNCLEKMRNRDWIWK